MTAGRRYPLGRIEQPDERDRDYPMEAALPPKVALPVRKLWQAGPVQDQGQTSACVGFSWSDWLRCEPLVTMDGPSGLAIYHQAQLVDDIPGQEPQVHGSTVRAGAKVMQAEGRIARYVWAWDAETVVRWVLTTGPAIVGTAWLEDMFEPDASGLLSVSGAVAGGHAYGIIGADTSTGLVTVLNHWGASWGVQGCAFMKISDLDELLKHGGEGCGAVERQVAAKDTPEEPEVNR